LSTDLNKAYELLGVKPGVPMRELKAAHRDLAKVWHPDRFQHDPRLQEKAQEKLKEINEAYDLLISGEVPRPRPEAATHTGPGSAQPYAKPLKWQWAIFPLVIFVALFFALSQLRKSDASAVKSSEQPSVESHSETPAGPVASESRNKKAESTVSRDSHQEPSTSTQPATAPVQAMATVIVLVDPSTGMLAKADCPTKTRMSYVVGSEPHGYCTTVHQKAESADSKVKTIVKRVVTPTEWVGSGKQKLEGDRQ